MHVLQSIFVAQQPVMQQIVDISHHVSAPKVLPVPIDRTLTSMWLSSAGASTALHFECYDNLLCQVSGYKYVRLYSTHYTSALCKDFPIPVTDDKQMKHVSDSKDYCLSAEHHRTFRESVETKDEQR